MRPIISRERAWVKPLGTLAMLILISFVPAQQVLAQGCGGMGHGGGQSGDHGAMQHEVSPAPTIAPIWTSMVFGYTGTRKSIATESISGAKYYGEILRDDFRALKTSAREMDLGMDKPVASANDRVGRLTKQIPKDLEAGDQASAESSLGFLETEITRIAALFPPSLVPADLASKLAPSDSLETTESEAGAVGADASENQVIYTCPMHPNVFYSVPGKCPLCGMGLVVRE